MIDDDDLSSSSSSSSSKKIFKKTNKKIKTDRNFNLKNFLFQSSSSSSSSSSKKNFLNRSLLYNNNSNYSSTGSSSSSNYKSYTRLVNIDSDSNKNFRRSLGGMNDREDRRDISDLSGEVDDEVDRQDDFKRIKTSNPSRVNKAPEAEDGLDDVGGGIVVDDDDGLMIGSSSGDDDDCCKANVEDRYQGKNQTVQAGVRKIEAMRSILTKRDYVLIYSFLSLLAWSLSLDQYTASTYLTHATSTSFHAHSLLAAINTIKAVGQAISQPAIAKLSDLWGRTETYLICVILYAIGYLIVSISPSIYIYSIGISINILGLTGLYLLQEILIGDISSLKNRLFWSIFPAIPGGINIWLGGNLADEMVENHGWRWGNGMFAILTPILSVPLIFTLFKAQIKSSPKMNREMISKRNGSSKKVSQSPNNNNNNTNFLNTNKNDDDDGCNGDNLGRLKIRRKKILEKIYEVFSQLDFFGLLLLSMGAGSILLNVTIANAYGSSWKDVRSILLFVLGGLTLISFMIWEIRFASNPILPLTLIRERNVFIGMLLAIAHPAAGSIASEYFYTFLVVGSGQSVLSATRISGLATFISIYICLISGVIVSRTKRLKSIIIFGGICDVIGFGLMIRYRDSKNSLFELVLPQLFRGISEGLVGFPTQAAVQAATPHENLASITAIYLMIFYLSGGIGSSIGGSIWVNELPKKIKDNFEINNNRNQTLIELAYKDPFSFSKAFGVDSLERKAVARAQTETQRSILIVAMCVGVFSVIVSLFLDDPELIERDDDQYGVNELVKKINDN